MMIPLWSIILGTFSVGVGVCWTSLELAQCHELGRCPPAHRQALQAAGAFILVGFLLVFSGVYGLT